MVRILNSGGLPAPVKILEEKIIEKKEKLKRRAKASIPGVQTTFYHSYNIRHLDVIDAGSIHLKKPSVARRANRSPMPWD